MEGKCLLAINPSEGKKQRLPAINPIGTKKLKMISSQAPPMRVRAESKGATVGVAILRNPYVPYLEDFWGRLREGNEIFLHIYGEQRLVSLNPRSTTLRDGNEIYFGGE